MLKYRLIFGTLMTIAFIGIVLFDPWKPAILVVLVAALMVPGMLELSKLAAAKGAKILLPCSIPAAILLATSSFWIHKLPFQPIASIYILLALTVCACFLYQHIRYALTGVIANIGTACFSILYLGLLGGFIPAIREHFGALQLLMLVFVVKACDIGAYTTGRLIGKHKFSPIISPKKTWEGMAGGVTLAVIVAVGFAVYCDIMPWRLGVIFGIVFAFLGQMGDLAESMLKRDAEMKDASHNVPGFGGILDVVDSILVTAPFGFLFFLLLK
ncbi:MAG: phosphatidate cytidylyltransferase [Sedimentisphaerales bacterium]